MAGAGAGGTEWLGPRVLGVTQPVAERWGILMARAGCSLPAIASLLAATALHHDLQFVTRNVKAFQPFDGLHEKAVAAAVAAMIERRRPAKQYPRPHIPNVATAKALRSRSRGQVFHNARDAIAYLKSL